MQRKLVVVGEGNNTKKVIEMISSAGCEILHVSTITEALKVAQDESAKMVIMKDSANLIDCSIEISAFKNNLMNKWTQLMVLTTTTDINRRTQLLDCGYDEVLIMPITKKELITRIKNWIKKNDDIEEVAFKDKLTMVYNRRYFENQIQIELARSLRENTDLSIVFIDLDKFKSINDTYGHDAGDLILVGVSTFLKDNTRATDIVSRFGGEEFIVLFTNTNGEEAAQKVQSLLEKCREKQFILPDETSLKVTFSSGVAQWKEGLSVDQWLKIADEGVYEAKRQGRNRVIYNNVKAIKNENTNREKINVAFIGSMDAGRILTHYDKGPKLEVSFYSKIVDITEESDTKLIFIDGSKEIDYKAIKEIKRRFGNETYICVIKTNSTRYDVIQGLVSDVDYYINYSLSLRDIEHIVQKT